MRSHYCGHVDRRLIGQEVVVAGWVHRRRDHGGVIFIDLYVRERRDQSRGIVRSRNGDGDDGRGGSPVTVSNEVHERVGRQRAGGERFKLSVRVVIASVLNVSFAKYNISSTGASLVNNVVFLA